MASLPAASSLRRLRHTGKAQDPPQIITRKTVQEAKKRKLLRRPRKHRRRQKHRSRLRRKKNSRRLNRLLLKGKNRSILSLNIPTIWKRTGKTLITTT